MSKQETSTAKHNHGNWKEGKWGGAIVSDVRENSSSLDSEDLDFYGGYLIAESVAVCNRPIIAAAPLMYRALKALLEADIYSDGDGMCTIADTETEAGWKAVVLARAAIKAAEGQQ